MERLKFAVIMLCWLPVCEVFAQQDQDYTNTFSIVKSYSSDIPISLQQRLDSIIFATAELFNAANGPFNLVVDDSSAIQKIKLDFTKGKLATKKQRYVAYLVNLIVPIYIPMHKVKSSITFSRDEGNVNSVRSVKSSAHILVGSIEKREDKMLQKYADKLFRELNDLRKQSSPGLISSIR